MAEPSTNGRSRSSITRLRGNKEASCGFDSVLFFLFFFFFGVAGFGMIDGFSIRRVRDVFLAKGRIFSGENLSTSFRSILLGSIVFRCARK